MKIKNPHECKFNSDEVSLFDYCEGIKNPYRNPYNLFKHTQAPISEVKYVKMGFQKVHFL